MSKYGFVGQELHWRIFRCVDSRLDMDPDLVCDVTAGAGGGAGIIEEMPEFTDIRWMPIEDVIEQVLLEKKRQPYLNLLEWFRRHSIEKAWLERCDKLDLSGTWARDAARNDMVVEALISRGIPPSKASAAANAPYEQTWTRKDIGSRNNGLQSLPVWNVKTQSKNSTSLRELDYPIGKWTEFYQKGKSLLFGSKDDNEEANHQLRRYTAYVIEPDTDHRSKLAHVTLTTKVDGGKGTGVNIGGSMEETRRYLMNDNTMIVKRTFWANGKDRPPAAIRSTEILVRVTSR